LSEPQTPVETPAAGPVAYRRRITLLAAGLVVLLAVGAVLWPRDRSPGLQGRVVVLDPAANTQRTRRVFAPLADFLAETSDHPMRLVACRTLAEFSGALAEGADFVVCPDGTALALGSESFVPLVAGRRPAPVNLRPRGVLLRRRTAPKSLEPWQTHPGRTILGDSLSLVATAAWREGRTDRDDTLWVTCAWGPDPYDHGPAIHAARLGAYDYVLARQWDVRRFLDEGLLAPETWEVEVVSVPVPDLVILANRDMALATRLDCRNGLVELGRSDMQDSRAAARLNAGLHLLRLSGFNVLLEPDFDLVRGRFPGNWPPRTD